METRQIRHGAGVLFVGMLVLGSSSCSSGSSRSSGPTESATAVCAAVGLRLGAPGGVPPTARGSLTTGVVARGEHSGDQRLDAAVRRLSRALDRRTTAAIVDAESGVQTACARLGLALVYHEMRQPPDAEDEGVGPLDPHNDLILVTNGPGRPLKPGAIGVDSQVASCFEDGVQPRSDEPPSRSRTELNQIHDGIVPTG